VILVDNVFEAMVAQGGQVMSRYLALAFLAVIVGGCSQEDWMRKIAPAE
jgi:hypothetical protein